MYYRYVTLETILIFIDYAVLFEKIVKSCIQNFFNNFRETSKYGDGPIIIHVILGSRFVNGDDPGYFAIGRKNTFSENKVQK